MIIRMNSPVPASKRFYDAKMFLEAWKLNQITFRNALLSLQRVFNDHRPNTKIIDMLKEVKKGTISVEVAAFSLESAYREGRFIG